MPRCALPKPHQVMLPHKRTSTSIQYPLIFHGCRPVPATVCQGVAKDGTSRVTIHGRMGREVPVRRASRLSLTRLSWPGFCSARGALSSRMRRNRTGSVGSIDEHFQLFFAIRCTNMYSFCRGLSRTTTVKTLSTLISNIMLSDTDRPFHGPTETYLHTYKPITYTFT